MKKIFITIILVCFANYSFASIEQDKATELQNEWDRISFLVKDKKQQKEEFQKLSEIAKTYSTQYPNSADIKAWAGIIISTEAGFYKLNIPKALKTVNTAKEILDEGLAINPSALDGGIYSSLGLMYFQVPGKPIGFGDKQLAENFLLKGIELSNNGMIANFFAGQFYFDQKDYQKAMNYFEKAKIGNFQANRELAKEGTLLQINQWIEKTKGKLN